MKYLLPILVTIIALTIYFNKSIFLHDPDFKYLNDLYDHSQWRIPLSPRIISDNELYQVASFKLVKDQKLFEINPEVPPLGKYLYALSILIFNNPYYSSLGLYFLVTTVFYLLAKRVLKNKKDQLLAVLLLLLSPLFASQLSKTMLDLPQLFFLLLHLFFVLELVKKEKIQAKVFFSLLAAISLGAFAACKFPALVIIILMLDLYFLFLKKEKLSFSLIVTFTALTYLASFAPYFLQGNNLIAWLKTQKWMLNFYLNSQTKRIPFMFLITVLTGFYKGWWKKDWLHISEWSLLWPAAFISMLILFKKNFKKIKNKEFKADQYLLIMGFALMISNLILPFWPRYFLLILPLAILFFLKKFTHHKNLIKLIVLIQVFHFVLYLRPSANSTLEFLQENWQQTTYQDMYNFLSLDSQKKIERDEFWRKLKAVDRDLKIENKTVEIQNQWVWPWEDETEIEVKVIYQTPIGPIENLKTTKLIREGQNWKLVWDWELIFDDFVADARFNLELDDVRNGAVTDRDGQILAEDLDWPFISLTANELEDSQQLFPDLHQILGELFRPVDLEAIVYSNYPGDWPQEIALADGEYDPKILEKVKDKKGVLITELPFRIYHHDGDNDLFLKIRNFEGKHPEVFAKLGGKISLMQADKKFKLVSEVESRNGKDFILE
ncbi:MAG: glycosyltransferase family 39 protein [Candidatus Woesebacteria bacterium]